MRYNSICNDFNHRFFIVAAQRNPSWTQYKSNNLPQNAKTWVSTFTRLLIRP